MQEVLGSISKATLLYMVVHIFNPTSQEVESREPGVQGYPWPPNEL